MKVRVLIVDTNPMIMDGITAAILNYAKHIDRSKVWLDFVSINEVSEQVLDRIQEIGAKLTVLSMRNTNPFKYVLALSKVIKKGNYHLVHAHGSSCTLTVEMLASALAGVSCCPHSHSTNCQHKKVHRLLSPLFRCLYKQGFACSAEAGKWLYRKKRFEVLRNGIETEKYRFRSVYREQYRQQFGLQDYVVIGQVAHFTPVKNHMFTLALFFELCRQSDRFSLVLMGDGELRSQIEAKAGNLGIADKVIFTGSIDYVPQMLSAIDMLVLPSHYEGFPFSVIEAQTAGLKVFASNEVTRDCAFSDLVTYLDLQVDTWVEAIESEEVRPDRNVSSENGMKSVVLAGYDIKESANHLTEVYQAYGKK